MEPRSPSLHEAVIAIIASIFIQINILKFIINTINNSEDIRSLLKKFIKRRARTEEGRG